MGNRSGKLNDWRPDADEVAEEVEWAADVLAEPPGTDGEAENHASVRRIKPQRNLTVDGISKRRLTAIGYVQTAGDPGSDDAHRLEVTRAASAYGLVLTEIVEERRSGRMSKTAFKRLAEAIDSQKCDVVIVERTAQMGTGREIQRSFEVINGLGGLIMSVVLVDFVDSGTELDSTMLRALMKRDLAYSPDDDRD